MVAPLPPVVDGPVYAVPNVLVHVDNVLPDALVKVFAGAMEVGHATSSESGDLWVPTTVALAVGQVIRATQTYEGSAAYVGVTTGTPSAESTVGIKVTAIPDPLPVPVFLSGISQCSSSVWLGSLVQGCTLEVSQSGTTLVSALITRPTEWFTLAVVALVPGVPLEARQSNKREFSPIGTSLPVFDEPESLSKPVVALPIRDCQTFLDISNVDVGAVLTITNGGVSSSVTSPWTAYTLVDVPPLKVGELTAQQSFTRCDNVPPSPVEKVKVTKHPVPVPVVGYSLCPQLHQFTVTDLVPGEILVLKRVVNEGQPGETVTDVGSQGVSSSTVTVDLPPTFAPTDPDGPVSLQLSVTLCGLETSAPPTVNVAFSTAPGPFGPPSVLSPLFECASMVTIHGAHPGSLIQVFSNTAAHPRCNPVVATTPDFVLTLWSPLVAGEHIFLEQTGCHANGKSKPVVVEPIPARLAAPTIIAPVLSDATSVEVTGVIPGARVFLYVEGQYRSHVLSPSSTAALPVMTPALVAGQFLIVTQSICSETSPFDDFGPGYGHVVDPVAAPSAGLGSNSNYFLDCACNPMIDVTVTITVTEDIVGSDGFGFQVNAYSQSPDYDGAQQYLIYLAPSSNSLTAMVDNWQTAAVEVINNQVGFATLPGDFLPAGYQLTIALSNDAAGNVTGATYTAVDNHGTTLGTHTTTLTSLSVDGGGAVTVADEAPIVAYQLDIVGYLNGEATVLSSGAGTITYSAASPMTVLSTEPSCVDWDYSTVESSNSVYAELPAGPSATMTQSFSTGAAGITIHRLATVNHRTGGTVIT